MTKQTITHHDNCTSIHFIGGSCSCEYEYGCELWGMLVRYLDSEMQSGIIDASKRHEAEIILKESEDMYGN